jgi:hypothetical protein
VVRERQIAVLYVVEESGHPFRGDASGMQS